MFLLIALRYIFIEYILFNNFNEIFLVFSYYLGSCFETVIGI